MTDAVVIPWPRALERSQAWTLTVDATPTVPLRTSAGEFVHVVAAGAVDVEARGQRALEACVVRPSARSVAVDLVQGRARFALPGPGHWFIEAPGMPDLYVFVDPPETGAPRPGDPGVRWFAPGQVHEIGELRLGPGETAYVPAGAVVRGAITALRAPGARLAGRGIVDNSYFRRGNPDGSRRPFLAAYSDGATVEGVTFIEPATWTVHLAASDGASVRGARILGSLMASDGIDIVGSSGVRVEGCFVRAADDCIALKACEYSPHGKDDGFNRDVIGTVVERCVLHGQGGAALEIGHELRCDRVADVRFSDIDVLAAHHFGTVFSIRDVDRATVEDVLYERIRVEHHYHGLIDLRVTRSRYSRDAERGRIRRVRFRDIAVAESPYNAGYSLSHIGGPDADHGVDDVSFERVTFGGRPVRSLEDLDLWLRHARGVVVR